MEGRRERPIILIVDDCADALDVYKEFFELEGYQAVVAADGEEALERVGELVPDVILMDLSMPVLDGYETARTLKRDARTRDVPVIGLTGHVLPRHRAKAKAAGFDTVVPKPCQPTDLATKIRSMLPVARASPDSGLAEDDAD